ncbi:hypothetical protein DFA_09809 [Cavenderia fasciculata]|uniref:Choline transporter-like protein n=1 Tax=Cavenderia fasciculata TaxID=261658 RepID=F4QAS1_CACFS|nr:uncharacterized protein DFA_09809 [Cavenderia fasciculata]EGG14989.1 hypothetical protein DFA_09809 [Cavenderia fasciculata]|eukprot:XP_004351709.1 hypothetical protein DFA_09809 [Cavenderia fasciculata]
MGLEGDRSPQLQQGGNQTPPLQQQQQYNQGLPYVQPNYTNNNNNAGSQQGYQGNPYQQPAYYQPAPHEQQQQQYNQQPYVVPQQQPNPVYGLQQPWDQQNQQQQQYQQNDNQPLLQPIFIPPQTYVYNETCEKFPDGPKYQDILYTVLFVIHLLALVLVYFVSLSRPVINESFVGGDSQNYPLLAFVGISALISVIYLFGWLHIARRHAVGLIKATFIINIIITIILCIVAFVTGNWFMGALLIFVALICFIFFISLIKRIDFTAALLTSSIELLDRFPACYRVGFASLVVNFIWLILWGLAVTRMSYTFTDTSFNILFVFMVFSFYWVTNVIKNVVHCTISGLFASWYFLDGSVGMPPSPTAKSFKRAITTSFGSICFGSLLLAIVSTLRYIAQSLQSSKNGIVQLVGCLLNCILSLFESVLQLFNVYAYTQVAIYGKSYCDAARSTMDLVKNRGADLIVNDNFISTALSISILLGAVLAGIVGFIISLAVSSAPAISWLMIFCISFSFIMIVMEVIYSGVVTTVVCFLMEPNILAQSKPDIYRLYTTTYNKLIL